MQSTPSISIQAIQQLLQQDLRHCQQLLTLLENEHITLHQRDTGKLQKIVEAKQALMMKLESSAKQRTRWSQLTSTGSASTKSSDVASRWNQLLMQFEDPELLALWDQVEAAMAACKQQNELNGRIINRGQRTLQKLMSLLRGKVVQTPSLYTSKGTADQNRSGHTSVKA